MLASQRLYRRPLQGPHVQTQHTSSLLNEPEASPETALKTLVALVFHSKKRCSKLIFHTGKETALKESLKLWQLFGQRKDVSEQMETFKSLSRFRYDGTSRRSGKEQKASDVGVCVCMLTDI